MSQAKRKTTIVSLTISSSSSRSEGSRSSMVQPMHSTLIQPISINPQRTQSPPSDAYSGPSIGVAPIFIKSLQNIRTTKGQLVVFECRIRATPPLQLFWYRENIQIQDSAEFRILRKKACLTTVPEEVCTLVITEAFPEDSGVYECIAENQYGTSTCMAQLTVSQGTEETPECEAFQFSPAMQASKIPPCPGNQVNESIKEADFGRKESLNLIGQQVQKREVPSGTWPAQLRAPCLVNTEALEEMDGPLLETLPKCDTVRQESCISLSPDQHSCYFPKEVDNHKRREASSSKLSQPSPVQQPSAFAETSTPEPKSNLEPFTMSVMNLPPLSSMCQPSMFNYERPKHFIQSQPKFQPQLAGDLKAPDVYHNHQNSPAQQNLFNPSLGLVSPTHLPNGQKSSPSSSDVSSPVSTSSSSPSSAKDAVFLSPLTPAFSYPSSTSGQKVLPTYTQSPAAFLSSVLPLHPAAPPSNNQVLPATPETIAPKSILKKTTKLPRQQSTDWEIQGSKDALIQDLERKLRCKDNLLHNGNQRLTYEERMARRLLGPDNAASVFKNQNPETLGETQENSGLDCSRRPGPSSQIRSRPGSSSDENEAGTIQEKYYPPRFLKIPEGLAVEEGRFCRIDFKVGGLPTPDVTWYLNGRPVYPDDYHKMLVSEKGVHSFIIEIVTAHDAGLYECVASNRAGRSSFTLQLDVIALERRRPPSFIHKLQNTKAFEGDSVRLECQVSAVPSPQIFWKKNSEMLYCDGDRISLFQESTGKMCLLIHDVNKKDAGWYTVSALNEAGVSTCNARLDVGSRINKQVPSTKQLKVRPTFSKYLALNGQGLDVKQAFYPEAEFQPTESYAGLVESEEL
ncbi:myotilin isoform X2 [Latimeria chalumnae]|nr:PREDICTED: myotilin isoform X2 [Latimeria chalumnae]XP_005989387.1 PREDICTED: myotilin isoform X2 [Latimeria chalumnae]XP_005989388.1 PREDICTED: myotilin isoform X2 [Latimeria chalumnae]XP_014340160.1 PREDICTED: myotilin isoform X2 [Latimeria chalumnae]|eukprot:XP_005989386.1 PREDICTED: myotilin isoform X2 [Latimeria chalumnae]